MSRWEKIYQSAISSPSNLSFQDLCYLTEAVGFEFRRQKGTAHKIYKHKSIQDPQDAMMNLQEGRGGKAKPYQVRILLDIIERYDLI